MILQLLAGISLGFVIGLLVGLTTSPVVAIVVGALTSGMMVLLGFGGGESSPGAIEKNRLAAGRVTGFGFACSISLLSALYVRTHNLMSPTAAYQVEDLEVAGFTKDEAHAWVAFKDAGLLIRRSAVDVPESSQKLAGTGGSVFFAQSGIDNCRLFSRSEYPNFEEQLNALKNAGGDYAKLALELGPLDERSRVAMLAAYKQKVCP